MAEARILDARPLVVGGALRIAIRLSVEATPQDSIQTGLAMTGESAGETARLDAFLPDRDVAALVPRYILVGGARRAGLELLPTIDRLVSGLLVGRRVRVGDGWDVRFLPWDEVEFTSVRTSAGRRFQPPLRRSESP